MSIAGYASRASVAQGGAIGFHVANAPASLSRAVRVTVARVGAAGPEDFSATFTAGPHPTPADASARGCRWPRAYTLVVPPAWPSGVYTATLTNADGDAAEVVFVVRARVPGARSKIVLVYPTTTFQAYNDWGGKSLYGDGDRSRRVSFDRPGGMGPLQTGPFLAWLARRGIPVEVCASQDLHEDARLLRPYQLVISSGHDEYWTKEMRDHVEGFVGRGGNAAFFSGNVSFWQARFEDRGRTLVCYRDAVEDPRAGVDNSRVTVQWAVAPVDRPENTMTGVGFRNGAGSWVAPGKWKEDAYRVNFPEHWVFEGTGLALGDPFAQGGVGYETDAADFTLEDGIARATGRDDTPSTFVVLAVADLRHWASEGQGGFATMGIHRRSSGTVFTAASTNWADALETSSAADRITHNVIARLSQRYPDHDWVSAGTAPSVVALSGSSDAWLVGVRDDGALLVREASEQNLPWKRRDDVGAMPGAHALALADGTSERPGALFLASRDGALWRRVPALHTPGRWEKFADGLSVVAMASTEGQVFAVTGEGRLVARPADGGDAPWKDIGSAAGVVGMTSINRKLFAVTSDGVLAYRLPVLEDVPWTPMARADGIVSIAGARGRIFGVTSGGALLSRDAYP